MTERRKQLLTWGEDSQAELFKSWASSSVRGRIKLQSRGSKASQSISLIEQLQHPFRVRNFGDKLISNCGCHSNQSFPCTYYNRENVNLVYRKRTDFGAGCVQLLIRTAEPPGEHRYGSWNNNMVYRSLSLPIISSTNLQKAWTDKNNLDMFVKSDQEITDEQCMLCGIIRILSSRRF